MTNAVVRINDYEEGGTGAVVPFDAYSATEMAVRLEDLSSRLHVVQEFFNRVMVKDQDYGVIPGTDKPALLKPGAEKLCELYGYAPMVKAVEEDREIASGFYDCRVTVALISKKTGESVAEGIGSANTHESRYRWRWVWEDKVPAGIEKSHLVSRTVGRNNTRQYRMENDDPWSLWNTVLKMAKKRALVDVTLSATRSSGLFTQDAEAFENYVDGGGEDAPRPPVKQPTRKSQRAVEPPAQVDPETGEVGYQWHTNDLKKVLAERSLTMNDLSGVLGEPVTKDNAVGLINRWLDGNPGQTLHELATAAVEFHLQTPTEQAALIQ